jgi:[methyl-Co(III) methanol-specific corrinoid protein]:coenzyme M methyltransferase
MLRHSPKQELLKTLRGEDIGYFPRCIPLFTPVVDMMKETGAYFPAANYEAEPMARLALAAHELGGWNATMVPWASTVEMEALGCEVLNHEDDIAGYPQFKKRAFEDAYHVTFDSDILDKGSFPAVFEATSIVRERIDTKHGGEIPIVSMFQGPFTIASYVIGVNDMYRHMIRDVKRAKAVLDTVSDLNVLYGGAMLDSGGDVIVMSDPAAEGLTGEQFGEILLPVYQKIAGCIRGEKFIHICGRTSKIAGYLPDSGFNGFSFDYPGVEVELVRERVGDRMALIGSVPTVSHLLEGSRQDVVDISLEMIRRGTDILSPSCGLPQYTPLENVRALATAIEQWNGEGV